MLIILLINGFAVWITANLLPGVEVKGFWTAVVVALMLGLVNTFIRPILILLSLPITILTFGLFIFIINAALVLLVSNFIKGFYVQDLGTALLFSLVQALVSAVIYAIL